MFVIRSSPHEGIQSTFFIASNASFLNPSTEAKTLIWMNKLSWIEEQDAKIFAKTYDFSGGHIDNIVRKIAMNEIITGERPEISEIHEMCKSEKIETPECAKYIGFEF